MTDAGRRRSAHDVTVHRTANNRGSTAALIGGAVRLGDDRSGCGHVLCTSNVRVHDEPKAVLEPRVVSLRLRRLVLPALGIAVVVLAPVLAASTPTATAAEAHIPPTTGPTVTPGTDTHASPAAIAIPRNGEDLASTQLGDGAFSTTFAVHEAQCDGENPSEESAELTVSASRPPPPVFVPDVIGLTVGEAEGALEEVCLELRFISGVGDVVGHQSPASGTEVFEATGVAVTVAATVPELVSVPNLVWVDIAGAPRILESAGLALGQTSGEGDLIRDHTPAAGTRVVPGSPIDLTVATAPVPRGP